MKDRIAALGCIVCRLHFGVYTPAQIHHVRRLTTSKKRDRAPMIPLCQIHHQGPYGVGIHSGRETWEKNFGDELAMVGAVEEMLNNPTSRALTTSQGETLVAHVPPADGGMARTWRRLLDRGVLK